MPPEEVIARIMPEWADTVMLHVQTPGHNAQVVMWPARLMHHG